MGSGYCARSRSRSASTEEYPPTRFTRSKYSVKAEATARAEIDRQLGHRFRQRLGRARSSPARRAFACAQMALTRSGNSAGDSCSVSTWPQHFAPAGEWRRIGPLPLNVGIRSRLSLAALRRPRPRAIDRARTFTCLASADAALLVDDEVAANDADGLDAVIRLFRPRRHTRR